MNTTKDTPNATTPSLASVVIPADTSLADTESGSMPSSVKPNDADGSPLSAVVRMELAKLAVGNVQGCETVRQEGPESRTSPTGLGPPG